MCEQCGYSDGTYWPKRVHGRDTWICSVCATHSQNRPNYLCEECGYMLPILYDCSSCAKRACNQDTAWCLGSNCHRRLCRTCQSDPSKAVILVHQQWLCPFCVTASSQEGGEGKSVEGRTTGGTAQFDHGVCATCDRRARVSECAYCSALSCRSHAFWCTICKIPLCTACQEFPDRALEKEGSRWLCYVCRPHT